MNWHAMRDDDFRRPIVRGMSRYDIAADAARNINDDELQHFGKLRKVTDISALLCGFCC